MNFVNVVLESAENAGLEKDNPIKKISKETHQLMDKRRNVTKILL